jgi:hypothetical protein
LPFASGAKAASERAALTLIADLVHDNLPLHPLPNHLADAAVAQLLFGGLVGEFEL